MARGWESKSVESQMEAAEAGRAKRAVNTDPAEAERIRQRGSLLLSRTRVLHDLERARNPRYREMLQAALKHLDEKLAKLS
ncbi:MAG TPA: hypothetical protein VEV17_02290 [Bryobacteraceae bacterium]|nr:hypothetical protein [Bryobacteraceae bacterium]